MAFCLRAAEIENFKAISEARIPLQSGLTALVGQNNSGKSSVLQALHWACRCVAHPKVQKNQSRRLPAHEFDFYPTEKTKLVGHNKELRQGRSGNPEISVRVTFEHTKEDGTEFVQSSIPIRQGNNDVVNVDLKNEVIEHNFYMMLKNNEKLFSSYIPGLAGIPLFEERRARLPVLRQAASGDANTVLRNILAQIKDDKRDEISLVRLSEYCSRVLGNIDIQVDFDESTDFIINSRIRTAEMENNHWVPLELAGTGVLQCIQIFAYIVLYQPYLLLIDEPDSHLHPDRQERLVANLAELAEELGIAILLTTHSPNVIRALPNHCETVWMRGGQVEENSSIVRSKMGWGILDKKIILITEDANCRELYFILSQWPEIERITAVWPVGGHNALPSRSACESLLAMTQAECIVVHRDGDFMTADERHRLQERYHHDKIRLWITDESDIEALFLAPERISVIYNFNCGFVNQMYEQIKQENSIEFENAFHSKRQLIAEDKRLYNRRDDAPQVATARVHIPQGESGLGYIHGKKFAKRLREKINESGLDSHKIFSTHCEGYPVGESLRSLLLEIVEV